MRDGICDMGYEKGYEINVMGYDIWGMGNEGWDMRWDMRWDLIWDREYDMIYEMIYGI